MTITYEELLTAKEAAKLLGISKQTLYRWCKRKWLVSITLPNGTLRIARISIDKAIAGVR